MCPHCVMEFMLAALALGAAPVYVLHRFVTWLRQKIRQRQLKSSCHCCPGHNPTP